ncbi:MAG TPA: 5-deoxy-glucuronate isomerase, partial [Ilumatobacteraceae bacterium]
MSRSLHRPAGTLAAGDLLVSLTPEDAGWAYTGLMVVLLRPGVERSIELGGSEAVVLPLSVTDLTVTVDGEPFAVDGRVSVFDRVTDFVYAPRGAVVQLSAPGGGEVAVATSTCTRRLAARYGRADDV